MKKCSKISMRVQSVVLVVAMLLSAVSPVLLFNAFAADDPKTPVNKSDAEIIVDNYELSAGEEALIASGHLIGSVHQYTKPDAKDELISVDIDSKKITVKTYEKESGYLWVPVSAQLVFEDTVLETVTLSKNGSKYEGTYAYAEKAFSVKVVYEMKLSIDEATQKLILAAPNALKQGVASLDAIADADSKLGIILLAMEYLEPMASDAGYSVGLEFVPGVVTNITVQLEAAASAAVKALAAQKNTNAGNVFDLSLTSTAYAGASSGVRYLIENGTAAKAKLQETYTYIQTIRDDRVWKTIMDYAPESALRTNIETLLGQMDAWLAVAKTALDSDWSATDTQYLKAGLNDVQYLALDTLVAGVAENKAKDVTVQNPLLADTVTLQYNMSMSDINVKVVLKTANGVIGSLDLEEVGSKSVKITLADGATKAEIQAAIDATGVVADAIASWGSKFVAEHYEAKYNVTLPDELSGDVNYVITYEPKTYTVTFDYEASIDVPYGYRYLLPASDNAEKAFDYTVNGVAYAEKSVYTVVGTTDIKRELGKAYVKSTLNQVVADCYFGTDTKAAGILTSGVFTVGNDPVNVRFPEQADGLVKITGMKLTAEKYAASYNGLVWVPYTYTVVSGSTSTPHDFNGATEVTITETEYDYVTVQYRLTLSNIDAAVVKLLANLPDTLEKEAAGQKSVLDRLASYESDMSSITRSLFDGLSGMIAGGEFSDEVKASLAEAVNGIKANCFGADGKLKLYGMIALYNDPNNGGLRYYYLHSAAVITEVNLLSSYLSALLDTQAEIDALTVLLTNLGYGQYVEKINKLSGAMDSIATDLTAPNAYIDLQSENLGKFVSALLASGDAKAYPTAGELFLTSGNITVNASNKYSVSVSVQIEGGKPVEIPTKSFVKGYVFTSMDVLDLMAAVDTAIAQLGASDFFYNNNYNPVDLKNLTGTSLEQNIDLSYIWTKKSFTVSVEGTADQTIDVDNREIKLPASSDSAYRFDYVVDGVVVSSGVYTFTTAQMERLFKNESYSIKRLETDVARENLINLVDSLNSSVSNGAIVFALTENNGEYAIVMKLELENMNDVMGGMQGVIMGLVSSGYETIGMGGEKFIYSDATLGLRVSLQTVVDAVMNSGFSTDTLLNMVDADGNVNHIALPGTVISALPVAQAGGLLAETTMELGSGNATPVVLPLYITAGSVSSQILKVRNMLAGEIGSYVSFACNNGVAGIQLTMPQKAYEAYLAVLLVTKQIDITDINAVNSEIALGFAQDLLAPVFAESVTVNTLANTLKKLGYKLDLTAYAQIYDLLTEMYRGMTFVYDANGASSSATVQIKSLIDSMNLGELGKMIAEYDTGISFDISLALANLGTEYEALYVDVDATGIANKFGLVQKGQLATKLASLAGTSVVVLLSDVDGDLVLGTTTVLDLNGFTVNGNVVANGNVTIIDTAIDENRCGAVTGTVSGTVTVAGGQFAEDVTAFVKPGYVQNADGVVGNEFYSLVEDANGNITLYLNAGALMTDAMPDVTTLLVNVAADLLMNGYTNGSLYVEGLQVYNVAVEDFVSLYSGANRLDTLMNKAVGMIDSNALASIINMIVADVTDFGTVADAIKANEAILSYTLTLGTWNAELEHVASGDYLTANLNAVQSTDKTLSVKLTGAQDEIDVVEGIFRTLAGTTDVDVEVKGDHVLNGQNLVLDWSASGSVVLDFSDPKYAVALSVAIADSLGATAGADLIEGIRIYYEKNDLSSLYVAFNALKARDVISAIKNLTKDDDFVAMVDGLGLTDCIGADVIEVEGYFDAVAKIAAAVLRRLSITGGDRTIGSYMDADGTYSFARESVQRARTIAIAKGYTVTVDIEATNVFFSLKLFGAINLDYTELDTQISTAEGLDETKYTPDSFANLLAVLDAAREARKNAATQTEIDNAAAALKDAIAALVEKTVLDYTELDTQISAAEGVDETKYTPDSVAKLLAALDAARAARNTATTQTEIDNAATALKDAIAALVENVVVTLDFTELNALIDAANLLDVNLYTLTSWNAMQTALRSAMNVKNTATTQAEVDAAADALQTAIDGLKKIPVIIVLDFTKLDQLIADAKALTEADYTAESWANLQTALKTAEYIRQTANSQFPINSTVNTLQKALDALEKVSKPPVIVLDFTELEKQIAAAEKLNAADYTTESWTAMQTALAAAKAAKNATAQADIDKAANDLKAAIAALEKPPVVIPLDYTELEKQIVLAGALLAETYTADSWAALETALAAANAAKTDATTQAAIDEAANALKAAIEALELAPVAPTLDFSALDALIAQVEALNPDEYTPESWAILQEALADAKNARDNANAQVDIDNLAVSLQAAVSELEKVEADNNLGWVIFWIILAVVVIAVAVVVIVLVLKKRNSGGLGTPGLD